MPGLQRPCIDCGELSEQARCPEHRPAPRPANRPSTTDRGYNHAWQKLSERARKLQPFCTDCNTVHDLTTDHTPEAWARQARGLPIRLQDVVVVCRSCNSRRGAARGERARQG